MVVTRFTNAGDVSTRGGELDATLPARCAISASPAGSPIPTRMSTPSIPPGPATGVVPSGTPLGFAPKWKGNLSADYRIRTGGSVDFLLGAQGSYQ